MVRTTIHKVHETTWLTALEEKQRSFRCALLKSLFLTGLPGCVSRSFFECRAIHKFDRPDPAFPPPDYVLHFDFCLGAAVGEKKPTNDSTAIAKVRARPKRPAARKAGGPLSVNRASQRERMRLRNHISTPK